MTEWWSVGDEFKAHKNILLKIFCHSISLIKWIFYFKIGKTQLYPLSVWMQGPQLFTQPAKQFMVCRIYLYFVRYNDTIHRVYY